MLHDRMGPPGLPPLPKRPRFPAPASGDPAEATARRSRWAAAAGLALAGLAGLGIWAAGPTSPPVRPEPSTAKELTRGVEGLRLRSPQAVVLNGRAHYLPTVHRFPEPADLRGREVEISVRIPEDLAQVVVQVRARDAGGRLQSTTWTDGQLPPGKATLRVGYSATAPEVAGQGGTDPGFDPSRVSSLGLSLAMREPGGDLRTGRVEVTDVAMRPSPMDTRPAEFRPLLRATPGPPRPLKPRDLVSGVSRYFGYGEMHDWTRAEPRVEEVFRRQQAAGLHAFRWMGGLDLRRGLRIEPEVYRAMDRYLVLAARHGQTRNIVTLLDGAIPNPVLKEALRRPAEMVETLRPFVRRYGNARVDGRPVIFDLVNEIHGVGGVTDRQRQEFVEALIDLFVQEAPGATLTVGVQNVGELSRWTYLFERYEGKPIRLIPTFHLYGEVEDLPAAWELNLPPGVEVGITEADPGAGVERQVREAARKGYSWLLFWEDARHPYSAAEHAAALNR